MTSSAPHQGDTEGREGSTHPPFAGISFRNFHLEQSHNKTLRHAFDQIDMSDRGLGAVMSQVMEGVERPISRKLSVRESTTWTQEIVDLLLHNGDAEICKRAPTAVRIPFLEINSPSPIPSGLDLLKTMKPPRIIKTHLPIQLVPEGFWENKCKVIYVARNAKDNLVSYYHFDQMNLTQPEPGSWEEYIQKFMKGKLGWGSWYDHVKGFWKEREKRNILYLFYEDMKENPRREIVRIIRYLDLSLSDDIIDKIVELTSFKVMKDNPMANYSFFPKTILDHSISAFMRKGEVGDWTNYFTPAQSQMFDEDYARQMADVDIPFRTSI